MERSGLCNTHFSHHIEVAIRNYGDESQIIQQQKWKNELILLFLFLRKTNHNNNNQICHLHKYFQDFDKRSTKRTNLRKYAQFFIKRTCFAWDWNSAASAFKYQLSGKLTVIVLRALNILFLLFEIFLVVLVFFSSFWNFLCRVDILKTEQWTMRRNSHEVCWMMDVIHADVTAHGAELKLDDFGWKFNRRIKCDNRKRLEHYRSKGYCTTTFTCILMMVCTSVPSTWSLQSASFQDIWSPRDHNHL